MLPLCLGLTSALLIGTSFGQTYHISLISTNILHDEYLGSDALDFHTKAHTYTTAKFITVQHDLSNPGIKPRSPPLQVDSLPAEPQGKPIHFLILYSKALLHIYFMYSSLYLSTCISNYLYIFRFHM